MRETSEIPLERMNELFDPELKAWRAHGIVMNRMREAHENRETEAREENASIEQKIVDEDQKQRSDHVEYV